MRTREGTAECLAREGRMSRKSDAIGRKVPRSTFERDRRTILKSVPKLRKIKPRKEK